MIKYPRISFLYTHKRVFLHPQKHTSSLFKLENFNEMMKVENMKLGEALSKLKKEKSRLARLISLRKDNVYTEEGKKTKFDPRELSNEINNKIEEIRILKIKIQKTNLDAKVEGEGITLAECIIKVNDLRSKLANLSSLFERKRDCWYKDKDEKEIVAQLDELEIEDEIEKIEIEKTQLDNKIQITNWTTKLQD